MKENKSENYYIDFLRFVFSIIIVFYHSWKFSDNGSIFIYGNLSVNFYFILTGYLMMKSLHEKNRNTNNFIKNKIKRLFPCVFVAFFISYAFTFGTSGLSFEQLFSNEVIADFLQLSVFGMGGIVNAAWWYLSAMMFALFLLYPLARKYKDDYIKFVAPLLLFIVLAIISFKKIDINLHSYSSFIFINGFYCAVINIVLGNISYVLSKKIKNIHLGRDKIIVLSIIETLIYIFLIINMHFGYIGTIWYCILFTFNIAITFTNISITSRMFTSSFWKKLGNYGFYIYLTHVSIRTYLLRRNNYNYNEMLIKFIYISLVVGGLAYVLGEYFYPYIKAKISLKPLKNKDN